MKLIILTITPYKERDGIITALGENCVISFNVRGLLNPKSTNHFLNTPLIEIDATFQEGNYKYKLLKNAKILFSPYSTQDSLNKLAMISLLQEATKSLLNEEEQALIYDKLKRCLEGLKNTKVNVFQIGLNYIYELLKISGNDIYIDGCVFCGSRKGIVGLSFADGGFVCKDCAEHNFLSDIRFEELKIFRNACRNFNFEIPVEGLDDSNGLYLLEKLIEFVYSAFGIKLKTIKLF